MNSNDEIDDPHEGSSNQEIEPLDPLANALSYLTEFQQAIVEECLAKGAGGLNLPMGTGKTMISLIVSLIQDNNDGHILVVASKTLIQEWMVEINDKFPNLSYDVLHTDFKTNKVIAMWQLQHRVILTTPEMVTKSYNTYDVSTKFFFHEREHQFGPEIKYYKFVNEPYLTHNTGFGILHSVKWSTIIIDEGHEYQNIDSKRCLAISSLCSDHRWLLSGTILQEPKPQKLFGYYLLIDDRTVPHNLPEFKNFIKTNDFRGALHSMVYREKNENFVIPEVINDIVTHPLTYVEAKIYTNIKTILKEMKKSVEGFKRRGDTINIKRFTSYIVGMLNHLRQCLICPLIPITSVALDCADFEQRSELSEIFMRNIVNLQINDWLNDINSLCSSRINAIRQKLDEDNNKKVAIYCTYRKFFRALVLYIPEGRPVFTISSDMKIFQRREVIDHWRNTPNGILLVTHAIGSTGLNLQFCDTVYIVDLWWNSDVAKQIVARFLRRGQQSDKVTVRFFTSNTGIENAILKLQIQKKTLANELMNGCANTKIETIKINEIIRLLDVNDNIEILQQLV